jgi:glucokinase
MVEGAVAGDARCTEALRLFVRLLGRFAGDLALVYSAGAIYLGGGIERILDVLAEGDFRAAFERKAPFEPAMRAIPTYVMTEPEPAVTGLAAIARSGERFAIDLHRWYARSPATRAEDAASVASVAPSQHPPRERRHFIASRCPAGSSA